MSKCENIHWDGRTKCQLPKNHKGLHEHKIDIEWTIYSDLDHNKRTIYWS